LTTIPYHFKRAGLLPAPKVPNRANDGPSDAGPVVRPAGAGPVGLQVT